MQTFFDKMGFGFSMICMIHCLIVPIVVLTVPISATLFFNEHVFHQMMLFLVMPTIIVSLFLGCRDHTDRRKFSYVVWLFFIGTLTLLYVGLTPESLHNTILEKILTLTGAVLIAGGHYLNHTLCKKGKCHTEHTT